MAKIWDYATSLGVHDAHLLKSDGSVDSDSWTFRETDSFTRFDYSSLNSEMLTPSAAGASPGMGAEVTFIGGVTAGGRIAASDLWNWNDDNPATYDTSSGDAHKWKGGHAGTSGGTVHFYFDPASNWTVGEKAVFKAGLTLWSDEVNIKFAPTTNASAADITFTRGSDGGAYENGGWNGSTTIGSSTLGKTASGAEISIDTSVFGFGPINAKIGTAGGYVWDTIVHEEGHLLGLGHAGPYNGNVESATQQYSAFDTRQWSIMSYIEPEDTSAKYYSQYTDTGTKWDGHDPTTPMMLDILAAQRLYGASTAAALSGGQTFGFDCNITDASKSFFDFTVNKAPVITIWDAGADNTLNLSGFSDASTINLNAGTFSSCDGMVNNICIAQNTSIDTAIGGSGNDTLIANANVDTLQGESGSNTYVFASAADFTGANYDTIVGFDAGADHLDVSGTITAISNAVTVGALSTATFDADLTKALTGHLGAHHAVEFTPNSGALEGDHFLIVDLNGKAGYQAGADLVVLLDSPLHIAQLSTSDFI